MKDSLSQATLKLDESKQMVAYMEDQIGIILLLLLLHHIHIHIRSFLFTYTMWYVTRTMQRPPWRQVISG